MGSRGSSSFSQISIRLLPRLPQRPPRGIIVMGAHSIPCAIGRCGIGVKRREGDGRTPIGRFKIVEWRRRKESWRIFRPESLLIKPNDGWCDDPALWAYNKRVSLPFKGSAETLWRDDSVYDALGVLDFNFRPRVLGRGSAIFFHLAHPEFKSTAGCVALSRTTLRKAQMLWRTNLQVMIGEWPARRRAPKIAEPTRT